MIGNEDFKSRYGYEDGDFRYDNVGRKEGNVTKAARECNESPNDLVYLRKVIENQRGNIEQEIMDR